MSYHGFKKGKLGSHPGCIAISLFVQAVCCFLFWLVMFVDGGG